MMVYLIQGCFFQWRVGLGIALHPTEGSVAVIEQGISQCMFSGAMWFDSNSRLVGRLDDRFGRSNLSEIEYADSKFKFVKKYERRGDYIEYTFRNLGRDWVGEYQGDFAGKGLARCLVTEVSMNFFDPQSVAELLGKPEYLDPPKDSSR